MIPIGVSMASDRELNLREVCAGLCVVESNSTDQYDFFAESPVYSAPRNRVRSTSALYSLLHISSDDGDHVEQSRSNFNAFMEQLPQEVQLAFLQSLAALARDSTQPNGEDDIDCAEFHLLEGDLPRDVLRELFNWLLYFDAGRGKAFSMPLWKVVSELAAKLR